MPPLSMLIKPVSASCNMHCQYCFYTDVSANRKTMNYGIMSPETMQQVIKRAFAFAEGSVSFAFQGGEPTMAGLEFFQDFVNTVRCYNFRNIPVSYALQTNSYALHEDLCAFFAKNNFLIGVSVDGTRDIHDYFRKGSNGEGSYDQVMRGIDLLAKYDVSYNVLCVVSSLVADQAKACWNNLKRHRFLQFIPCIDGFDGALHKYSLTAHAYGRFLIETFQYYERAYYSGKPVSERRFDNYLSIILGQYPEACGMSGICGQYFLVEADGGVYPCDFYALDEWRLGSVYTDSLFKMAKSELATNFLASSRMHPEICRQCPYYVLCRDGCRRDREQTNTKNRFCESYKMFFDNCLPRMKKMANDIINNKKAR